jgi:hypothetical protein
MRAIEFTINIPITIKLGDGTTDPQIDISTSTDDADDAPVFVPPLQQEIEVQKAIAGKKSKTISSLLKPVEETVKPQNKKNRNSVRKRNG